MLAVNTDPKYADYYAMKARQDDVTAMGGCNCCASVHGRPLTPRRYWWTGQNGHRRGLCESCLAVYAECALEDDDLLPVSVTLIA